LFSLVALAVFSVPVRAADEPLTVAESSGFKATSHHADVVRFCQQLAKQSNVVQLAELGKSSEGRILPMMILAAPPVSTPEQAARSGKLVVYAQGNIHAGEVDAKEALLMLARDIATGPDRALLKNLIVVIAPIFNADGNERFSKTSRPGQVGPEEGQGIRANAQGYDLNRDFVKLESPEVRALVRFCNEWDPAIVVDGHTTNGSYHRYTITYDGPRTIAGDNRIIAYTRDTFLPEVSKLLKKKGGWNSFFYGNFEKGHDRWGTVPGTPRYGIYLVGLMNRISVLSESYSYATYKDRILATHDFVHSILTYASEHKDQIASLLKQARESTIQAGKTPKPNDLVGIRQTPAPLGGPVTFLGFYEEPVPGRRRAKSTGKPRDYQVVYYGKDDPAVTVPRPFAYLLPAADPKVVAVLQRHGIEVEEMREDLDLNVEVYKIDKIERASRAFQKHTLVEKVQATRRQESRRVKAGTIIVKTGQALGDLAIYLLEPQSEDGLTTWNFFDNALAEGKDFPVLRLAEPVLVATEQVPPAADKPAKKKITFESVYGGGMGRRVGGRGGRFFGGGQTWLEDGEHYLEPKSGRLQKVEARTGKSEPYFDPEKLAKALSALPGMNRQVAQRLSRSPFFQMNPQKTGALFENEGNYYFCQFDGTKGLQLTKTAGKRELPTFSPNGEWVAFVKDQNLYVVDLATQNERALTTDGGGLVYNGKADWVYWEEIFNRNARPFWWSPDSAKLAFMHYDDHPVPKFAVVDPIPPHQTVEDTTYPRAGDPNPTAALGIVGVSGGSIRWADVGSYPRESTLIDLAGWWPDGSKLYLYIQDRAQTWLDVCTVSPEGGPVTKLFRDTTKAFVSDPGPLKFLKDGSFLIYSERTGWRHLYHYDSSGKLLSAVTSGEWEVRDVPVIDEQTGWVYLSGTKESSIAANLYRVKLDGTGLERLTQTAGSHQANVSPRGNLYIDSYSTLNQPNKVALFETNGKEVRVLDNGANNPLDQYQVGKSELVKITAPDGFVLEGLVILPPDFDAGKKYPVWFQTYGGPHAPTVSDTFQGGRLRDHYLATLGFIVFHADPRSASGKGAVSTWTAYRKLGIQEMKDIETAIKWICEKPYVDAKRIGMSGASYGGFMTSFCLTHSKLFAAGIAAAPVTDWKDYDSIYTERYMDIPEKNPDGYKETSVVSAARNLHGRLLLVHGMMDDNVHLQNSAQLILALQQANKQFDLMIYPRSRHGGFGLHFERLSIDFMVKYLKPGT
jgi:dipeptidyl aminopeptidase/acylaminoacyl peptidase